MIGRETCRLEAAYCGDAAQIEAGEKPVSDLLRLGEYLPRDAVNEMTALCRREIVMARIKLASDDRLSAARQRELWSIVDCQEWFLKFVADDFHAELEQIDRELEQELRA